jgi:response regulator RpfG family c-di-GMP phosphodiesterase
MAINGIDEGRFKEVTFTEDQLEELEFAGLLHDIGKLVIPDAVLDKQNKLTDDRMRIIEYRFSFAREQIRTRAGGALTPAVREELKRMDHYLTELKRINIPRGMKDEDLALLEEIRGRTFTDVDGKEQTLLTDFEYENLSVRRGNLTASERQQIENHIVETWDMLKTIPWPKYLRRIPNIASTHHEKLDGVGYPWKLEGDEIPLAGKILAVADIFEALTAQDRPYKPPIPIPRAIEIVRSEVEAGHLDKDIFDIFLKYKVYAEHLNEETGKIKLPV